MTDEKPLYLSERTQIVVPGFASHCRYFRGKAVEELHVREDGTGIYLKAGHRSIGLVYRTNSLNMITLGEPGAPETRLHMFPTGKEGEIRQYILIEDIEEARIAIEQPNVIKDLISTLYEGREMIEAMIETRHSIIVNMKEPRIPNDTAFFAPSPIPIRFTDEEIVFFMEPNSFLYAVCENDGEKTVYAPKEADR